MFAGFSGRMAVLFLAWSSNLTVPKLLSLKWKMLCLLLVFIPFHYLFPPNCCLPTTLCQLPVCHLPSHCIFRNSATCLFSLPLAEIVGPFLSTPSHAGGGKGLIFPCSPFCPQARMACLSHLGQCLHFYFYPIPSNNISIFLCLWVTWMRGIDTA